MKDRQIITLIVVLLSTFLLLGACGNVTLSSGDIRIHPEVVKDGTVSEKYYHQIADFYRDSRPLIQDIADLLTTQLDSEYVFPDEEYTKKVTGSLDFMDHMLSKYNTEPITEKDKELHELLKETIVLQEEFDRMVKEYLKTYDEDMEHDLRISLSKTKDAVNFLDIAVYKMNLIEPQ